MGHFVFRAATIFKYEIVLKDQFALEVYVTAARFKKPTSRVYEE
jgi:hypothetical protein